MPPLDCAGEKLDLILCYFHRAVPGHWVNPSTCSLAGSRAG